jgi:NADH-quinone oxidoreductase subunit L
MWVPLAVLAVLSVAGGWIGTPFANWFEHFLEPSVGKFEAHHGLPIVLGMAVGLAAGLAGILYARKLYGAKRDTAELMTAEQRAGSQLYQGSIKLWGVDSFLYDYAVVRGGKLAQFCWQGIDRIAIDGTINFLGGFAAFLSEGFRRLQTGYIRAYALTMMIGVVAVVLSLLMGNLSR